MTTLPAARTTACGFALTACTLALLPLAGCNNYPEASSPDGLRLIAALRTACSTQSPPRLAKVEEVVRRCHREGKLGDRELRSFDGIIATARGGDWRGAERACFSFQRAQLRTWW